MVIWKSCKDGIDIKHDFCQNYRKGRRTAVEIRRGKNRRFSDKGQEADGKEVEGKTSAGVGSCNKKT